MKQLRWLVNLLVMATLVGGWTVMAAEDDPALLRFETAYGDPRTYGQGASITDFTRWGGKSLSPATVAEVVPSGGGSFWWLLTGGKDQAIAFDTTNTWHAGAGAFSLWVTGQKWDLGGSVRETLVTIEGDDATVTLERNKPGTLAVVSSKGGRLDVPFKGDPNAPHFIVVNYDAAQVTLYLDTQETGAAKGLLFPAQPQRLVLGQLGDGPGPNKHLERFVTYKRPLTKGDIAVAFFKYNLILDHAVTIPHLAKPIVIDGIMDDPGWKEAAVLSGMTSAQEGDYWHYGNVKCSEVEDQVYLAYDDKFLYIGYHNPAPKQIRDNPPMVAAMMKVSRTGFDTDVDSDDCFEIRLRDPAPVGDNYRMVVNQANTHYDYTIGAKKLKGININWNPAWITKSTLDLDGWHLECAIPLDCFDLVPAPKPGEAWHMTFIRNWKTTLEGSTYWAAGARTKTTGEAVWCSGVGDVRFAGDQTVVVRLMQVGDINAGQVDIQAELVNESDSPQTVKVALTSNSGEVKDQQEVSLAPKERKPYAFKGRIVDFSTTLLRFEVKDAAGAALFVHELPVARSDKIDVYAFNYPSFGLVRYDVGCLALAKYPAKDLKLAVTARDSKGKKVFAGEFTEMPDYHRLVEIPMKDWTPGPYTVQFVFSNRGQTLAREEAIYHKKPLPDWYGNKIGYDTSHPPEPWTAVQAAPNQVNLWGRQYEFGSSLLPEHILTQGRQLLRAPMTLSGETAEKGAFTSAGAKAAAKLTAQNKCRAEGERGISVPGLTVTNAWWVEYDGFCWVKLILTPEQKASLKKLTLSIPFTKEFSDVMNCCDYSIRKNDVIPAQGGVTHSPSLPIWVGNAVGGLQFHVDTTGPWNVKDESTSIYLENGPEGATMNVTMVDVPLVLTNAYAIEVAFTVTPTKEIYHRKIVPVQNGMAGYSAWSYGPFPNFNGEWMPGHKGWWREGGGSWSQVRTDYDPPGWLHAGPYSNMNYVHCNTTDQEGNEDVREFGDEWSVNPAARWRLTGGVNASFHSPSYQDFMVWRYHQLFLNSPFRCMYHDVSHVVPSSNPWAQAGYLKPDGGRAPSKGLLGLRNVYKRYYNFIAHYFPEGANSVFHSSGVPNMSYESFGGWFWTDENLNGRINEQQPTYRGLVTPAKFRAEYMGRNFGNYSMFIGQGRIKAETCFKYGVDAIWDHIKGLCLLHDMQRGAEAAPLDYRFGYNPKWNVYKAVAVRDKQAIARHDVYSLDYNFVGYWDQKAVTAPNTNTYVSLYIRKTKETQPYDYEGLTGPETVFIICNESDATGERRLDVDWKALGFDVGKPFKAENLVHRVGLRVEEKDPLTDKVVLFKKPEETARVEGGKLVFPMTEWNYRMIAVSQ